jgi:thioredoxin 1
LLELGMGICAQCKRMKPVMQQAAREFGGSLEVRVLDIRNESNAQIAERYQMRVMPLVLLVDGEGRELWRHEGYIGFDALRREVEGTLP